MISTETSKAHSWFITMQITNMENAGWSPEDYRNPEWLANAINGLWENSGHDRKCAVSVCISEAGLYHAHIAAYSKGATTFNCVRKIFYNAHIEPQLGNKKELAKYLLKEPPYDEKNEKILFTMGIENIEDRQGKRNDLDEFQRMIDAGMTPNEIFSCSIHAVKYSHTIKEYYYLKRKNETPSVRDITAIWHVGKTGCGKSYSRVALENNNDGKTVYCLSDYQNGGFDRYNGEHILFMDEFKGEGLSFGVFLQILDKYKSQVHARYANAETLWNEVHISSIYPPEKIYEIMVNVYNRDNDSLDQLMRRLTTIIYHYKEGNEFKSFSIPATEYINYDDLKRRAMSSQQGVIPLDGETKTPFDEKNK